MASHKGGWLVSVIGDALLAVNYGRSGLGDCGLNGYLVDGKTMPESFEEQADVIWTHIGTLLQSAGMGFKNLVSLRTYLADPEYDEANVRMRVKYLGDHETSSTVVCCQ